ncbi:MAG: AraC family transcriptional regulator [Hyphomicrobiaceae bacterium]|nr:AraC family transcriptional regulator [Hyphomicrobiaceae bacterium]
MQDSASAPAQFRVIVGRGLTVDGSLRAWRDEISRTVLGIDVRCVRDAIIDARVGIGQLGRLSITRLSLSPIEMIRSRELIADGDAGFSMSIIEDGQFLASQNGEEFLLRPGQAVIMSASSPSNLLTQTGGVLWGLKFAPADLRLSGLDPQRFAGRRIETCTALKLLRSYAGTIAGTLRSAAPADVEMYDRHMCDLIGATLRDLDSRSLDERGGVRIARRQALYSFIEKHACDPELTLARAARALDMSERSVQALLTEVETCFTDLVRARRLETAYSALIADGQRRLRILDVAYESGFQDISTFNRLFRARYGMTPRQAQGTGAAKLTAIG